MAVRLADMEISSAVQEFGDLAQQGGAGEPHRSIKLAAGSEPGELVQVFRTAREIAFDALGPQHLFGGAGPWYRWQISDSLIQLEHHSWGVRLSLLPKDETENAEYQACEWGDRDHVAAEVGIWVAEFDKVGMWNGYSPGGVMAPDWKTFQQWATETLQTLESDLTILDTRMSILLTPVRGDARSIQVLVEPGTISAVASQPHHMDRQVLGSLGWQTAHDDTWFAVHEKPSQKDIRKLASLITDTLRSYGIDLNRVKYSTTCRHSNWINVLGLGLCHL
ncbi:TY-Chap domain-containing protein [Nocardia brasiliensis]|uniref:TY-Chap domain-containing protein n=1 Tax=Nocardia brasiliensis TaxID=37326 RepID=UPI0024554013|nr:hypothetical protein [Nocardia brasiliensis]